MQSILIINLQRYKIMISVEKLPLQYMTLNVSVAKKRKAGNTNTASKS
jgi:hypothetical protein